MNPLRHIIYLILVVAPLAALADAGDVEGRWLSGDGEGWIRIERFGDDLVGVIAGSPHDKDGDPPKYDDKNPDPGLRDRPLQGMTIMSGFRYVGDGRWTGGRIYDPNSGRTYKATVRQLNANTLKVRGHIGISLFGRSDTWTRDDG